jgi:hypothetical protein
MISTTDTSLGIVEVVTSTGDEYRTSGLSGYACDSGSLLAGCDAKKRT